MMEPALASLSRVSFCDMPTEHPSGSRGFVEPSSALVSSLTPTINAVRRGPALFPRYSFRRNLVKRAERSGSVMRPLVDRRSHMRWDTIAPRKGEFSVDSANWWEEFRTSPTIVMFTMPLRLLVLVYAFTYLLLMFLLALLFYLIALGETASLSPDSSFATCMQVSWQSLTTVGYGGAAPTGFWSNAVCAIAVVVSLSADGARARNLRPCHRPTHTPIGTPTHYLPLSQRFPGRALSPQSSTPSASASSIRISPTRTRRCMLSYDSLSGA